MRPSNSQFFVQLSSRARAPLDRPSVPLRDGVAPKLRGGGQCVATARLHALVLANGELMKSPDCLGTARHARHSMTPATEKARQLAIAGLVAAEEHEARGDLSDRTVATMKAAALANAASTYHKAIADSTMTDKGSSARGLINYWEMKIEQCATPSIEPRP